MTGHAYPHGADRPRIDATAYIAPGARIVGDVTIGPRASVWFNAILRADNDAITIGAETNIQDGSVLHTDEGHPCIVGDRCTIGHIANVHGCRIGDGSLVGMGAIVLTGAVIGEESLVAAGALVPEGKTFGPRSLLVGSPARSIRQLTDDEVERLIRRSTLHYLRFAKDYASTNVNQDS
jgi:carbonic anhydrase/acetyltransferase-like protein (isoleucine patch superfamily)